MAKNKITHYRTDKGTLIFQGSLRQPTDVEINNYCAENHIWLEGVFVRAVKIGGGWCPPDDCKEVELIEFSEECPVCGKPFVLDLDICPICRKRWNDD